MYSVITSALVLNSIFSVYTCILSPHHLLSTLMEIFTYRHTGDMRQYIGKILLSHGIDFANYGISSSNGGSEQGHPFTCALLAAHNTVGKYQNGRQVHGGKFLKFYFTP